jgi:hypothetical protein
MKTKRTNQNQLASDPQVTIGAFSVRRSILKSRLENFTENASLTCFPTDRANKMNCTWIKNNLREIVNAVYPPDK